MDRDRAMELLNNIIGYKAAAENNLTVIQWCLFVGFEACELINDFGFLEKDVQKAECNMESYIP